MKLPNLGVIAVSAWFAVGAAVIPKANALTDAEINAALSKEEASVLGSLFEESKLVPGGEKVLRAFGIPQDVEQQIMSLLAQIAASNRERDAVYSKYQDLDRQMTEQFKKIEVDCKARNYKTPAECPGAVEKSSEISSKQKVLGDARDLELKPIEERRKSLSTTKNKLILPYIERVVASRRR